MSPHAGAAVAIVPVRLGSQRLPGKALLSDSGRPLFLHTFEQARRARSFAACYVATDSDEVAAAAERHGAAVIRTSPSCRSGSERCAEAMRALPDELRYVVDLQGDWPEVAPADLDALVDCLRSGAAPIATLAAPDHSTDAEPNVVKVVRRLDGDALYFSRAPIPFDASGGVAGMVPRLRHIGVYAFTREALARVPGLPSSGLDAIESLEQLRFLENGLTIRVLDATTAPWGIETRADYEAFLGRRVVAEDR